MARRHEDDAHPRRRHPAAQPRFRLHFRRHAHVRQRLARRSGARLCGIDAQHADAGAADVWFPCAQHVDFKRARRRAEQSAHPVLLGGRHHRPARCRLPCGSLARRYRGGAGYHHRGGTRHRFQLFRDFTLRGISAGNPHGTSFHHQQSHQSGEAHHRRLGDCGR